MLNTLRSKSTLFFSKIVGLWRSGFGRLRNSHALLRVKALSKNRALAWFGASVVSVLIVGVTIVMIGVQNKEQALAYSINLGSYNADYGGWSTAAESSNQYVDNGELWHVYPCIESSYMAQGNDTFEWLGEGVINPSHPSSCWQIINHGIPSTDVVIHCAEPDNQAPPGNITPGNVAFNTQSTPVTNGVRWDSARQLDGANGGQDYTIHVRVRAFKPVGVSKVQETIINPGTTIVDEITTTTEGGTVWIADTAVKYCVRAYGPYATPQTAFSGDVKESHCTGDVGQPDPTASGAKFDIKFTALTDPGHYYFQIYIPTADGQPNSGSLNGLPWSADFDDVNEHAIVRFQPFVKSDVVDETHYLVPGSNSKFVDKVTSYAATSLKNADNGEESSTSWLNNTQVRVCVKAWGPYQQAQSYYDPLSGNASGQSGEPKAIICTDGANSGTGGTVDGGGDYTAVGQTRNFNFITQNWVSGFYYFTEHIIKDDQLSATKDLIIGDFNSKFNPRDQDEWGVMKFQPYFTSKVARTFVDDLHNNYQIVDTITSHATMTINGANNGADLDATNYWLNNIPVKVCVKAWGPYQRAQPLDYDGNGDSVPDRINGNNVPSPITLPIATLCSDNTSSGTGGSVTGGNFTKAKDTRNFTFNTTNWTPGYYYFTEHMTKANQPNTTVANDFLVSDWHSKFNPMTTGDEFEDEATIEKFQIKPTSQTVSPSARENAALATIQTGIDGDANHNGQLGGESTKNSLYTSWDKDAIPVLKPTDAYIEDSFSIKAYDTNSESDTVAKANDAYWLKDLNNDFITFYVCATIYGPYQQPQGSGSSATGRIPATGIGNNIQPNIPANYFGNNNSRGHCFWTDHDLSSNSNDGLVASPTYSGGSKSRGGPGTYTIRWDNRNDKYFQPGYYYVVWSVDSDSSGGIVGDNDAENYCTTTKNNCNTIVNIGENQQIQQRNGDFLESSWWSPFGEQTESFYAQFQPIAKSTIPEFTNKNEADLLGTGCSIYFKDGEQFCYRNNGFYIDNGKAIPLVDPPTCSATVTNNCVILSTSNPSSDNTSNRKKSAVNSGNGGIILECDENKYSNLVNYVDNPEEYPHEKLHCHNVTDQIWLGAVNDKAINHTTHEVASQNNNDYFWPKNKDGQFEPVKFQVKLYGPFKYPYTRTPADENKAGLAGDNLVTVVPKNTDGKAVETAQNIYGQPVAQSCVISTANVGPNWDGTPAPYDAVFTQDIGSCSGGTPSNNSIELTPGFYVSVVEIVRDDIESANAAFKIPECKLSGSAANAKCATQIMTRPHNMIIEDRFTSAWGDLRESLLVPIPLYIITRRDNSAQDTFIDQVTINDQYWVAGFDGKYVDDKGNEQSWTDIWGQPIPAYGTYSGEEGYVMDGSLPNSYRYSYKSDGAGEYYQRDIAGDIHVRLYGAYPLESGRPNENNEYCVANKLVKRGTWQLPAEDTPLGGKDLPYPAPLTLYEKGWYVFQYTYEGGDRITNIKTQCGDTHEMFRIVKNEIGLVTAAYADSPTAPTRVTDKVQVTGSFEESDKNSIVKLSLYKRAGLTNSPGLGNPDGAPLCTIIFTISATGVYDTKDHIDENGYTLADEKGSGRCYAETGGHYYWIEEFLRPGSNPSNPTDTDYIQPIGQGQSPEDVDILPPPVPEVTTDADPTTSVNRPFHDTATVTNIPKDNTKVYYLWFTAYGPFTDGTVDCNSQLIYSNESSPIAVTQNGRYDSEYITVPTNGIVYWVEHLQDDTGNIVDQGECGTRRENTYVVGPDSPVTSAFEPFQVTSTPLYPDAGYISQQVAKVVALGIISMLGAWQLTNKNSWLLRKR
jgi:hypothetical protein